MGLVKITQEKLDSIISAINSRIKKTDESSLSVAAAAKLSTARNINGVAFDGTKDITIPVPGATSTTLGGVKVSVSGSTLTLTTA